MSLASAIERERQDDHSERMSLGFEVAEFPEVEEGTVLLSELGGWLNERYPGRIVSWRPLCTKIKDERPSRKINHEIILEAEALIQTYGDLSLEENETLFSEIGGRFVVTAPRLPVKADPGHLLLGGWRHDLGAIRLRERKGLLRLKMKSVSNRTVWTTPEIRLDTNLSKFREDGALMNIADVSDNRVWPGDSRGVWPG